MRDDERPRLYMDDFDDFCKILRDFSKEAGFVSWEKVCNAIVRGSYLGSYLVEPIFAKLPRLNKAENPN